MKRVVTCPETITSPAPSPGALALGLKPNMVCGMECHVEVPEGAVAWVRCPVGHDFYWFATSPSAPD